MTAQKHEVGAIVRDTGRNRTGRVMGHEGPYVQLRPVGGGREWDARPGDLRPATRDERLSADVTAANARSTGRCL
ncbi:hypothetical protein [Streptomyces ossamyceticus]|uniref:hypothetical protein n=1 Tax=Streptomyces ossamyceticus TaxID=249581 RepID=UPI003414D43A